MKIIATWFNLPDSNIYERLTKVFVYSIIKNIPGTDLELYQISDPETENKQFQNQIQKQRIWTKLALRQTDDYIIVDTDMIITADLSIAFKYDFDIAYTGRDMYRKPLNGGMIFCRSNNRTNSFWEEWLENCEESYEDKKIFERNNLFCKGFAQSALWHTINNYPFHINIKSLPCQKYNACDEEWSLINDEVRAIHIKGRMRKALFGPYYGNIPDQKVYNLWREYERECNSCDQEFWRKNNRIVSSSDI